MRTSDAKLAELEAAWSAYQDALGSGSAIEKARGRYEGLLWHVAPDLLADIRECRASEAECYAKYQKAAIERDEARAAMADARKAAGDGWAPHATLTSVVDALRKSRDGYEANYLAKHQEDAPLRAAARLSDSYKAERDELQERCDFMLGDFEAALTWKERAEKAEAERDEARLIATRLNAKLGDEQAERDRFREALEHLLGHAHTNACGQSLMACVFDTATAALKAPLSQSCLHLEVTHGGEWCLRCGATAAPAKEPRQCLRCHGRGWVSQTTTDGSAVGQSPCPGCAAPAKEPRKP